MSDRVGVISDSGPGLSGQLPCRPEWGGWGRSRTDRLAQPWTGALSAQPPFNFIQVAQLREEPGSAAILVLGLHEFSPEVPDAEEELRVPQLLGQLGVHPIAVTLNNKVRVITKRGCGFRSFRAVDVALDHNLGRLPGPPPTHKIC